MAKISNNQPAPILSDSDLKKSTVTRNKKLASANKDLEVKIKLLEEQAIKAEKKLKVINEDYKKFYNENDRLSKDIVKVESKLVIANNDLTNTLESASRAISSESEAHKSKEEILKEHSKLSKEVSGMYSDKNEFKKLTKDLSILKQVILEDSAEMAQLKNDKNNLAKQKRDSVKRYDDTLEKEEMIKVKLEVEEVAFKVKLEAINKELSLQEASNNKKISELYEDIDSKNKELEQVNKMIEKAEKDYIKVDKKVSVAKNNVLEEESRQEKIKEDFADWKVLAVDEMARMKLRGRMENIDKAGLKDVLG